MRIAQWNGDAPVLTGTDLHFSGGGVEIEEWQVLSDGSIKGKLKTDWVKPVKITAAFPSDNDKGYEVIEQIVMPKQKIFFISKM